VERPPPVGGLPVDEFAGAVLDVEDVVGDDVDASDDVLGKSSFRAVM
jgi:hypothetical protein